MNDKARELLVKAALDGVPQVRGNYEAFTLDKGEFVRGYCALGILGFRVEKDKVGLCREHGLSGEVDDCPVCGFVAAGEPEMIIHLNDTHGWDFLQIARKVGLASEESLGVKESQE